MEPIARSAAGDLRFERDGAELVQGRLASSVVQRSLALFADQPPHVAGVRLFDHQGLRPLLDTQGAIGSVVSDYGSSAMRPVRALLFNKTLAANWALGWHQDRVIAVRERIEVPGFGPWSRKHGALHVAPPFVILAEMITIRVHLDAVSATNAPLLVAPGSHRLGRILEADAADAVRACGVASCLAGPGDVWVYSTSVLHASERAIEPKHRRVLQVDYAADELPGGLTWLGV